MENGQKNPKFISVISSDPKDHPCPSRGEEVAGLAQAIFYNL